MERLLSPPVEPVLRIMKTFVPLLMFLSLVACSKKHPAAADTPAQSTVAGDASSQPLSTGGTPDESAWYWSLIEEDVAAGAKFHSEFPLAPGEVKSIDLATDRRIEVGLVVRDGYEIFKSEGSISLGTVQEPRRVSGTPGFGQSFDPVDGMLRLRIENTSKIASRVAVHMREVETKQ